MAELDGTRDVVPLCFHGAYGCVIRRRCLQTLEASGLGEGWSDALAEYVNAACWDMLGLRATIVLGGLSGRAPLSPTGCSALMCGIVLLVLATTRTPQTRELGRTYSR